MDLANGNAMVIFEARVLIDGVCVSSMLLSEKDDWPRVIEWTSDVDKNGNNRPLSFPIFHNDILTQSWWSAGQDLGRVKVIIAEGFAREHCETPFERTKNLINFSFQHAPLEVLEASGVAWPNPDMWHQVPLPQYVAQARSPRKAHTEDYATHAHSPRQSDVTNNNFTAMMAPPVPFPALSRSNIAAAFAHPTHIPSPVPQTVPWMTSGPFFDNLSRLQSSARWSKDDHSMPDYSRSATTASSRSATGLHSQSGNPTDNLGGVPRGDQITHLLEGVDPGKGVMANGEKGGTNPGLMNPPPSMTTGDGAPMLNVRNQKTSTCRTPQAGGAMLSVRATSDVSMRSQASEEPRGRKENVDPVIRVAPATTIKSKKEGKEKSGLETPVPGLLTNATALPNKNDETTLRPSSGNVMVAPKRKRSQMPIENKHPASDPVSADDLLSSPTRKFSKGGQDNAAQFKEVVDLTSQEAMTPLSRIENNRQR